MIDTAFTKLTNLGVTIN